MQLTVKKRKAYCLTFSRSHNDNIFPAGLLTLNGCLLKRQASVWMKTFPRVSGGDYSVNEVA